MATGKSELVQAFHEDHTLLGSGFYDLSMALRGNDISAARLVAQKLNADGGAHIAFEEECFYPALAELCDYNVDPLYQEHRLGRDVVESLCALDAGQDISADERLRLLTESETMESHIAECGELFKAIERLPDTRQNDLYKVLMNWRRKRPAWLDLSVNPREK